MFACKNQLVTWKFPICEMNLRYPCKYSVKRNELYFYLEIVFQYRNAWNYLFGKINSRDFFGGVVKNPVNAGNMGTIPQSGKGPCIMVCKTGPSLSY